ncbi:hypothetical protein [Rhodohalobacter halophilus]|uniref:hypothetical protein n=1 Tax=Rhodohalobacter halophilus TaxID=1812810 RepID=UPI00083F5642|nr:hypothetical protein [Rhodohalobacter halophilus]
MSFRYYILSFLLFGFGFTLSVNAQQIFTFVETDSVEVGDIFEFTIVVSGHDQLLSYPDGEDFEDDLELLERNRYQTGAGRDSLVYRLQFFGTDDLTIARKSISLRSSDRDTTLYSNPVPLFFRTVLSGEDDEFRPLKPIFEFARAVYPWILGIIAALLLGYLIYRHWEKFYPTDEPEKVPYSPKPFNNPLEQLRSELKALPDTTSLSGFGEFESFYIKLGDSIRRYIKRVHSIPAMEMTTSEITSSLKKGFTSPELIAVTKKVLNSADMVKFAHFEPTQEMADQTLEKAGEFLTIASKFDSEVIESMRMEHERSELEKIQTTEENE